MVAVLGAGLITVDLLGDLPAPDALITRASPDTTKILDRQGRLLFEVLDPRAGRRTRLPLGELPVAFRQAVLAVEDANFYQHPGVDIGGVARAVVQFAREGQVVSGGSTITQQLARDLLLSREERESRSLARKLREMVLAVRLTAVYPKDTILEMYLNEVYFGQLAYGAEAAARAYFGKPARELDLAESALLAGLIQSPAAYNPLVNFDAARQRQGVVLGLMVKDGFIGEAEARLALNEPLHFAVQETGGAAAKMRAPHFVTYVLSLLEAQYGAETVNHGGLRVVTTLDLDLQERAEATIRRQLSELARRTREEGAPDHHVHDAALVALNPTTGEIVAMVGSPDYFDASIDGAVNVALAKRQPGSAIKPITYAAAFSRDYTAATVLSDVPTAFLTKEQQPYEPQNYDRAWHGPIALRQALATSSNMIAVKVLDHIGLGAMVDTARALGISTFSDPDRFGLSLTLGGGEVKLLELTAAFAAFANLGRRVEPVAILNVASTAGCGLWVADCGRTVLYDVQAGVRSPQAAIRPPVAYLITNILSDDAARIPAFGENGVLKLSRPAAAKTGTTSDFRDNWTVGYTPDLAVGVWVGNANNEPMYQISGITGAGPIWHDFMEEALKNRPAREFERPDGLIEADVCITSGLLATELCPRRRAELFIAGTEPTRYDDSHRRLVLDGATGLVWADGCRGPRVERIYWYLPADAQAWGRKQGVPEPPAYTCKGQPVESGEQAGTYDAGTALMIVSPAPNATFALSPQISLESQQIEISARATTRAALREVTLWVDGAPMATFSQPPYRVWWPLAAGAHEVVAVGVTSDGQQVESAPIRFWVERE
ncbi:MAG: PBP1A family penicillin-binding protein [Chloroflexi bacterium]|nr:PBP1A family penicillin-binding protein [Chloroflexota bacterium]